LGAALCAVADLARVRVRAGGALDGVLVAASAAGFSDLAIGISLKVHEFTRAAMVGLDSLGVSSAKSRAADLADVRTQTKPWTHSRPKNELGLW
jgi:hypothetical protein